MLKYVTQDNSKFYVLAHIGDDSNCYDLTYQSLYNWDPNSLIYVVDEDFSVNSISSTGILPASSENINGFEYLKHRGGRIPSQNLSPPGSQKCVPGVVFHPKREITPRPY